MVTTHNLGFPRIGACRELKFALEACWRGETGVEALQDTATRLKARHWQQQAGLDLMPVGDFSLYDQVLDMSLTLGHVPARIRALPGEEWQSAFRLARGRAPGDERGVTPAEMTKWFDTNYHYLVPEFEADTCFQCNPGRLLSDLRQARDYGEQRKVVIIGPVTYLWLGKSRDGSNRLDLLERLLPVYRELLDALAAEGVEWVQIDEPALATDLDAPWQAAFGRAYHYLQRPAPQLLLTTYFGPLGDNLPLVCELPVQGLHIDAVRGRAEVPAVVEQWPADRVLSLGVVDGRNVWRTDLNGLLDWLEPVRARLGQRLWLAPSCSLLHVPVDLALETDIDPEVRPWLAFARQKLEELELIATALDKGRACVAAALDRNREALASRRRSRLVCNPAVREAVAAIEPAMFERGSCYERRARAQRDHWRLPLLPTTTIGSFPQTADIRQARKDWRLGYLGDDEYRQIIAGEIAHCIREQEQLGLDVLVHGEAERNDMVEYFGEQLAGYVFTRHGWVQSYGSRCVKPPILYGDVTRSAAMTVAWTCYAQSLTNKPVKGMLTGPVTLLNWSFVRDDQPREITCRQLALAIRAEVQDLEAAGIGMIQIDEPALREGLPLRAADQQAYLEWAVAAFRLATAGVKDKTQIHTHMCYSEFNDIMPAIIALDADVITIETSRSAMALLEAFEERAYPNEIGPGIYDIHSPNIPGVDEIEGMLAKAEARIPVERLWVNPDCGLKTRGWEEVKQALRNMVDAAAQRRAALAEATRECV